MTAATNTMKPLALYVSAHDIANGVRRDCKRCPLALAAFRVLRRQVSVGYHHIVAQRVVGPSDCWSLNAVTKRFLLDFDGGKQVQPMRVLLDVAV